MLDPHARQLLDFMASLNLPPVHEQGVANVRANYRDRRHATQPEAVPVAEVRDHTMRSEGHDIVIREFRPHGITNDTAAPALLYLHGGGWTIGDIETHDTLCRALAQHAGVKVFSVDYRMGPEHRFPAAVLDSHNAWQWLQGNAGILGVAPGRIAIGGDSAGGNLATVTALLARDRGGPMPAFQLLIYPATDQQAGHDSHQRNGEGYLLTRDMMTWFREQYHASPAEYLDWRASPLLTPDLAGLPPALVVLAGYDPLVDEGQAYADRMRQAGVKTHVERFDAQIHGFITMGRVIPTADDAIARCGDALRSALSVAKRPS